MKKLELIDVIAESIKISKASAGRVLNVTLNTIKKALRKGDTVRLAGFGTFKVSKRAERYGRNPLTGKRMKINAANIPKFVAGTKFKSAISNTPGDTDAAE